MIKVWVPMIFVCIKSSDFCGRGENKHLTKEKNRSPNNYPIKKSLMVCIMNLSFWCDGRTRSSLPFFDRINEIRFDIFCWFEYNSRNRGSKIWYLTMIESNFLLLVLISYIVKSKKGNHWSVECLRWLRFEYIKK